MGNYIEDRMQILELKEARLEKDGKTHQKKEKKRRTDAGRSCTS
jgi:hypothetical protein